jgi:two-component system osmolarity sensor histidine kinase EnvZ
MTPPGSIARRFVGLVVVIALLSLALNAVLFVAALDGLVKVLDARTAGQSAAVAAALRAVPPAARPALAQTLARDGLHISREAPNLPAPPGRGPSPWQQQLVLDQETWWLWWSAPPQPPGGLLGGTLVMLALVALAGLAAALLATRLVTRPLQRLRGALESRRERLTPIEEDARGGDELRAVVLAFNAMAHALALAESTRRDLLAGLSHDLRTPLARLQLRAEIEGGEQLSARLAPDLQALGHIVDQFLAYAHGDAATSLGRPAALGPLLAGLVARSAGAGREIHLTEGAQLLEPVPELALLRIAGNLVDNAIAHGQGDVQVAARREGRQLVLEVRDAGRGIAPDDLAHALQPFTRLRGHTAAIGHCGLGLAIVAQLAARLGGEVQALAWDGRHSGLRVAWVSPARDSE